MRSAIVVVFLLVLAAPAVPAPPNLSTNLGTPIEVMARAIPAILPGKPDQLRVGQLVYRGGLVLTSPNKDFGGLSGLRMAPDGAHFIALTDKGFWFTGRIVYDGTRPAGIADAAMAPMLGPDGRPLTARRWYDTEALAANGGTLYVGIERVHRIVKFDFARWGVAARAQPIATPSAMRSMPSNRGIEGLVLIPKGMPLAGTLIAFSERSLDRAGNLRAFLIGGKRSGTFTVRRMDDFDISDATLLPGGDLLVLERRFSWVTGVAIRMRRIALSSIAPGAVVDGPALFFADMGFEVDNMEALGVHRLASGETVLTLLSDDNFSPLQRTLLLQFTLLDE
ncbi:MAG: esterase-like activity of phytase family protein [Xanthobacteraceae bacterium]